MITFILHTHFHFDKPKIISISTLSKNVQFSKSLLKIVKVLDFTIKFVKTKQSNLSTLISREKLRKRI